MGQQPESPKTTSISTHASWQNDRASPSSAELLPSKVPAEYLERVIRRAAELQNRDEVEPGELSAEEVVRIAQEVGLDARHVRRALAETHAEALSPELEAENRLLLALFGSGHAHVRRVMAGEAPVIQQRIESLLRQQAGLAPLRQGPLRSLWERARGRAGGGKRQRGDRNRLLTRCRSVELKVDQLESDWTLVNMTADISNYRTNAIHEQIWWPPLAAVFAANIFASWFGIAATSLGGWMLGLTAFGIFSGIAIHSVMRKVSDRRQRVTFALDDLLDRAS